jgi:membrane protease YdiL (CAAX protease family)
LPPAEVVEAPRPRTTFWWVALVAVVTLMVFLQWDAKRPPEEFPDPAEVQSLGPKILARLALSKDALAKMGASSPELEREVEKAVLQQSDSSNMAKQPTLDRLREAVGIAEGAGPEKALERLTEVEGELDQDALLAKDDKALEGVKQDIGAFRAIYERWKRAKEAGTDVAAEPAALDAAGSDRLAKRHPWFAELAMSQGLPVDSAERAPFLAQGARCLAAIFGFGGLLLLVIPVSLVCFTVVIVRLARGTMRPKYPRLFVDFPRPHAAFLETFVIFLVGLIAIMFVAELLTHVMNASGAGKHSEWTQMLMWVLPFIALWPLLRGMSWRRLRAGLGWHAGSGALREVGAGIFGYLAGLPLFFVGIVLTLIITMLTQSDASHPVVGQADIQSWVDALKLYVLASLWAPITEETMFRGAFFHHMRQRWGAIAAAAVSGFTFAVIHPQGAGGVPALMALGVIFALIREWRGSIIGPMFMHGLHNGCAITLLILLMA